MSYINIIYYIEKKIKKKKKKNIKMYLKTAQIFFKGLKISNLQILKSFTPT